MNINDEVDRIPGLTHETRDAWEFQLTPPDGMPSDVYEALARAQGERWGYAPSLGDDGFERYVHVQAHDANVRADVHVVWRLAAEHFGGAR